ncbi:hypothetical protein GN958_ATG06208 [Phytophthora infestans]|uniref:Uncharacterized protein n=2 Tax=Phytophthora infestans TaxID=4787 RepID=A0A8S9UV75_PHYIN|nr:hypothetical protein GN958_ATG06208 [Phytophthora infestans]
MQEGEDADRVVAETNILSGQDEILTAENNGDCNTDTENILNRDIESRSSSEQNENAEAYRSDMSGLSEIEYEDDQGDEDFAEIVGHVTDLATVADTELVHVDDMDYDYLFDEREAIEAGAGEPVQYL